MTVANVQILLKRGNTTVGSAYTGPLGELTLDTTTYQLRVHDGATAGGRQVTASVGNLIPSANVVYTLGNITNQWKDLYVSNNTIYMGGIPLSSSNGQLTFNGSNVAPTAFNTLTVSPTGGVAPGIDWQFSDARPLGYNPDTWYTLSYGNGKFVAIQNANSNTSAYTTDGITWYESTMPCIEWWNDLTFGDGKFVAITNDYGSTANANVAITTDGITWTGYTHVLPQINNNIWLRIVHGNDRFVALATGDGSVTWAGPYIAYSITSNQSFNGNNWTLATLSGQSSTRPSPLTNPSYHPLYKTDRNNQNIVWESIAYGGGRFVAFSSAKVGYPSTSDTIAVSSDGIGWKEIILPLAGAYAAPITPVYGNGTWIVTVAPYPTNKILVSIDNCENWTEVTLPISIVPCQPVYGSGQFLLYPITGQGSNALVSSDGFTWSNVAVPTGAAAHGVAYGAGTFVTMQTNASLGTYSGSSGTVSLNPVVTGEINNMVIGEQSPAAGEFTQVTAADATIVGNLTVNDSITTIGNITAANGNIAGIVLTNNSIYSSQLGQDIQFGQLAATANIVMNRNVVHNRDINVIGNITANNATITSNLITAGGRIESGYQFYSPTANIAVTANVNVSRVILAPTGNLVSFGANVILPAGNVDAKVIRISSNVTIAQLAVYAPVGTSVSPGGNITLGAGNVAQYFYHSATTKWYKVG